jgi:general secretion pathway protein M
MNRILQLWHSRSRREHMLLAVLGLILFGLVYWFMVIQPVGAYRAEAERDLEAALALEAQIRELSARAEASPAEDDRDKPVLDANTMRIAITTSARQANLTISRLAPGDEGAVTVWFEAVTAPRLHAWLEGVLEETGARVSRVSLSRNDRAEALRAQIRFEPGLQA